MKWIPLSERKPTLENYDMYGKLYLSDGEIYFIHRLDQTMSYTATHWLEFQFPPIPQPEKLKNPDFEILRKAFSQTNDNSGRILCIYNFLQKQYGEK